MDKVVIRSYELTYILPGTLTDSEAAPIRAEVDQILKKYKAEVTKTEDWGRRPLAYVITHESKKNSDGIYVHIMFKLASNQVQALEREISLSTKIMRHLLLVADETTVTPSASSEGEAGQVSTES